MAYRVEITARAERDLTSLYGEIDALNSRQARSWYWGLKAAILGLGKMPNRNPITSENKRLRHLLYGFKPNVYRIIFRVRKREQVVEVLHIRHGARRGFARSDTK